MHDVADTTSAARLTHAADTIGQSLTGIPVSVVRQGIAEMVRLHVELGGRHPLGRRADARVVDDRVAREAHPREHRQREKAVGQRGQLVVGEPDELELLALDDRVRQRAQLVVD